MKERTSALALGLGALALATLPAIFCVFQPLFTDSTSLGEHALSLSLTAAAYLSLGALLGYVRPPGGVRWGLLISLPALLRCVPGRLRRGQGARPTANPLASAGAIVRRPSSRTTPRR
jgi:hypothetical protein